MQSRCRPGAGFGSAPLWHYKCFLKENKMVKRRKPMFYLFFALFLLVFQGQVEVCAVLQDPQSVQEKAEYYVLLKGSQIHHITSAQRKEESRLLNFIIPGRSYGPIIILFIILINLGSHCSLRILGLRENEQTAVYKKHNNTCIKEH